MKKALTLLLVAAMLISPVLTACSDATDNAGTAPDASTVNTSPEAAAEEVEEEEPQDFYTMSDLPRDLNLEGYEVKFSLEEGGNGALTERSVWVEEDTGDVVDSAVYQRNLHIMEGLNCKLSITSIGGSGTATGAIRTQVQAGSDDVQIGGLYQYYGTGIAAENLIFNLANAELFPYNDFDREYWGVQYIDDLSYKGSNFFVTGPMALRYTGGVYVTYINSSKWNEFYTDQNIYDIVRDGKWTLDKLYEYSNGAYVDKNGDGTADAGDFYGNVISCEDPMDGMAAAANVKWSEKDADGNIILTLNNEHTISFYEKLYNIMYNGQGTWLAPNDDNVSSMNMFAACQALIAVNKMYQAEVFFRDMADDYAILPPPMLDENQEFYNSCIHDSCTIFCVPITVANTTAVSAVLEALAAESARLVSPAYYEQALKVKYTRDSDAGDMIDLIYSHISTDFAFLYSSALSNMAHVFRTNISSKSESLASSIARSEKAWNKTLERFVQKLDEVAEKQG
ncbi:MAG: hypothetical protein IJB20_06270 [Clostridia bacterium]|nr:hypothetical protein [Clostridia bacterium]